MRDILELENVSLIYQSELKETEAVKDLSFSVKDGEFVSIIGPSGCGKTTVLSMIAGLIPTTKGKILYKNEQIEKVSSGVSYMLQRDELFPWRTIEKNVYLPLEIKKIKDASAYERANDLIKKYGLEDFKKAFPHELSGGMRQRAALIRTLSTSPDVLLLDEPFSALDYQTRLSVCNDVYKIIKSEKKTAILVTHDISEAISLSDRILVLTKRPATLYKEHVLPFNKRLSPLKRREQKEFPILFDVLWRELNDEN
ncbi:MAG: ABC transporter ATP-binding protein [Clostridia bacterium]|nr:ABC transporter ATP-binding protein [Clostridia bacterium]